MYKNSRIPFVLLTTFIFLASILSSQVQAERTMTIEDPRLQKESELPEYRVSYCTNRGCDRQQKYIAASAFCILKGYAGLADYDSYETKKSGILKKKRKHTFFFTPGVGWTFQENKRRWFTSITCSGNRPELYLETADVFRFRSAL